MKNTFNKDVTHIKEIVFANKEINELCGVASITSLILLPRSLQTNSPLKNTIIMITNMAVIPLIESIIL